MAETRRARHVLDHQALLSTEETAQMLGKSRSFLADLRRRDATFPQPIRLLDGTAQQFIRAEVDAWIRLRPRLTEVDRQPEALVNRPRSEVSSRRSPPGLAVAPKVPGPVAEETWPEPAASETGGKGRSVWGGP